MAYRDLSQSERAAVIKAGVASGIRRLADIEAMYNDAEQQLGNESTVDSNTYANGGSIHIAPSKKGTFTAAATKHGKSVQEFASQVLAHKENYSPAMVKKANFARNAAHWHDGGGTLGHEYGLGDFIGRISGAVTPMYNKAYNFVQQLPRRAQNKITQYYNQITGNNAGGLSTASIGKGQGTDIVTLDRGVIRVTPETEQTGILFNDFVPSSDAIKKGTYNIRTAEEFQNMPNGFVEGRGYGATIPLSNFNIYAGIEDGHFKADSLSNFNPSTPVYPVRNIKSGQPMITEFLGAWQEPETYKEAQHTLDKLYSKYSLYDTHLRNAQHQWRAGNPRAVKDMNALLDEAAIMTLGRTLSWDEKRILEAQLPKIYSNWDIISENENSGYNGYANLNDAISILFDKDKPINEAFNENNIINEHLNERIAEYEKIRQEELKNGDEAQAAYIDRRISQMSGDILKNKPGNMWRTVYSHGIFTKDSIPGGFVTSFGDVNDPFTNSKASPFSHIENTYDLASRSDEYGKMKELKNLTDDYLYKMVDPLHTLGYLEVTSPTYGEIQGAASWYNQVQRGWAQAPRGNDVAVKTSTGEVIPVSKYAASIRDKKAVLGNPNGGLFIADFNNVSQGQLDTVINPYLREHPSWLVMPDMGAYSLYGLQGATDPKILKAYNDLGWDASQPMNYSNYWNQFTEKESKAPYDPNVHFAVGTTLPVETKSIGGPLYSYRPRYPFSFSKRPLPAVRYGDGGFLGWLKSIVPQNNVERPAPQGLDYGELRRRQAYAESGFRNNTTSKAGARGMFQIEPSVLQDYNAANGTSYTNDSLYDQAVNASVRDWYMNRLQERPWVTKGDANDSIQYAKSLAAYNFGPTATLNKLNEAKAAGVNIYEGWDWLNYLPTETQDYVNFILRGINSGLHRNDLSYKAAQKLKSKEIKALQ